MSSIPLRVLIAGGGVAAVEAALALHALARERVRIELLAPSGAFVQRPSSVLSPFGGTPAPWVSLDGLTELGIRRHPGSLAAVDPAAHRVRTTDGGRLGYDRLVVATGARPVESVPGATTFRGPISAGAVEGAVRAARSRVLFVAPPGCGWPLPIYELALLAAHKFPDGPELAILSPEPRPLDVFGRTASDALARLLDREQIDFVPGVAATQVIARALVADSGRLFDADAVIALASLRGPSITGLPHDPRGFIPLDAHGRVRGVEHVLAAGDATAGPVKQGGLAAQQADAAAELIAAEAGAPVTPRPARRILRGVVLTGETPLYLRRDLDDERDDPLVRPLRQSPRGVSRVQLWWPNGKIAARYLTGFLAAQGTPGDTLLDRPPRRPLAGAAPRRSPDA